MDRKKHDSGIQGPFLHLLKHTFPTFLSFILHGSSSVCKLILCSAPKALFCPNQVPHFLLPDSAGVLCLEFWWAASSICCVEGEEKDGKYHPFSRVSFPTECINKSESSCACSCCKNGRSRKG